MNQDGVITLEEFIESCLKVGISAVKLFFFLSVICMIIADRTRANFLTDVGANYPWVAPNIELIFRVFFYSRSLQLKILRIWKGALFRT